MSPEHKLAMTLNKLPVGQVYEFAFGTCDLARALDLALGGASAFRQENQSDPKTQRPTYCIITKLRATGMELAAARYPALGTHGGSHVSAAADAAKAAASREQPFFSGIEVEPKEVRDSRAHGEQPDTPENWTGERRARYWQTRATMVENALAAITCYRNTQTHHAIESDPGDFGELIDSADRTLAESRKVDQDFDLQAWQRDRQQQATTRWTRRAFGPGSSASVPERALRMFEEAAELYQTIIFAQYRENPHESAARTSHRPEVKDAHSKALAVFDMRWSAEPGDIEKEAGGLMVTLSALADVVGINLHTAEQAEFQRVLAKPQSHWTAREAEKRGQGLVG